MPNLPVRYTKPATIAMVKLPEVGFRDLYPALLADARTANTRRAREKDMTLFASWLQAPDPETACAMLCSGSRAQANAIVLAWRSVEAERGTSPASWNRRLCTLRKIVELANQLDLIDWHLTITGYNVKAYRDTSGPGRAGWRKLWQAAVNDGDGPTARRDRAFIRLMHDSALRVSEATQLDMIDLDLARARVNITGKGSHGQKRWVGLSAVCVELLTAWLEARGTIASEAVFVSRPEAKRDRSGARRMSQRVADSEAGRLLHSLRAAGMTYAAIAAELHARGMTTPTGKAWTSKYVAYCLYRLRPDRSFRLGTREVNRRLARLSELAGLGKVRPHGLRHEAITTSLDKTNGDIVKAQSFARHASVRTTQIYNDNRKDVSGECAALLGNDD